MSSLAIFVGGVITGSLLTFVSLVVAAKKSKKKSKEEKNEESDEGVSDIMQDYGADDKYVISPEIFGEGDFDTESLTMYSDGVLAYSYDKNEVVNADELIGISNLAHVGEYEDNTLCVRNEETGVDYEIEFVLSPWKDG